jgi:hypothetical protein
MERRKISRKVEDLIKLDEKTLPEVKAIIDDFLTKISDYDTGIFVCISDTSDNPVFDMMVASNIKPTGYPFLFTRIMKRAFPTEFDQVLEDISESRSEQKEKHTLTFPKQKNKDFPS